MNSIKIRLPLFTVLFVIVGSSLYAAENCVPVAIGTEMPSTNIANLLSGIDKSIEQTITALSQQLEALESLPCDCTSLLACANWEQLINSIQKLELALSSVSLTWQGKNSIATEIKEMLTALYQKEKLNNRNFQRQIELFCPTI